MWHLIRYHDDNYIILYAHSVDQYRQTKNEFLSLIIYAFEVIKTKQELSGSIFMLLLL